MNKNINNNNIMENTKYYNVLTGRRISLKTATNKIKKGQDENELIPVIKVKGRWVENKKVEYAPHLNTFDTTANIKKYNDYIDKWNKEQEDLENYKLQTGKEIKKLIKKFKNQN